LNTNGEYENKMKGLKMRKKEAMKRDFKSSKERKSVVEGFKKEARSIKRSDKNKVKMDLRKEYDI
jgi:hypothetical protein